MIYKSWDRTKVFDIGGGSAYRGVRPRGLRIFSLYITYSGKNGTEKKCSIYGGVRLIGVFDNRGFTVLHNEGNRDLLSTSLLCTNVTLCQLKRTRRRGKCRLALEMSGLAAPDREV
jgi:hypothetical protein